MQAGRRRPKERQGRQLPSTDQSIDRAGPRPSESIVSTETMEGIDQQKILETALRKVKEQAFYMKHAMVRAPCSLVAQFNPTDLVYPSINQSIDRPPTHRTTTT